MKFYLSSYRFGAHAKQALAAVDHRRPAAIVPNALDFSTDSLRRDRSLQRERDDLKDLDLASEILDLREWFHRPLQLREELTRFSMLWVVGGNTFILRRAFHLSGLDELVDGLQEQSVLYAGYSAGACILGPTLHGIHLADNPEVHPPAYQQEVIWEGLNLLPYCVVPHFNSAHPESPAMDSVVEYYRNHDIQYVTLSDGEDLIV